MPNALWYFLLALSSVCAFAYTLWKVRDKKLIAMYSFIGGITFVTEYVVFTLLHSYAYRPHLLANRYFDNVMGAFVSDAFVLPMVGATVAAFQLHFQQRFVIAVIICLVEELFLYLGIYYHFWWRTLFTLVGLMVWFTLAKHLYPRLHRKAPVWLHSALVGLASIFVHASIVFFAVAFFDAYRYEVGWFRDPTRGHVAFATTYILAWGLALTPMVVFRLGWVWRILVLLLAMPVDWLLWRYGILQLSTGWHLPYFVLLRAAVLGVLELYNRYILDQNQPE